MTTCYMGKNTICLVPYSATLVDAKPDEDVRFAEIKYKVQDEVQKVFALGRGAHRAVGGVGSEQIMRLYWTVLALKGGKQGNMQIKELEVPLPTLKLSSPWAKEGFGKSAPAALLKVPVITNIKDLDAETRLTMKGN